MLCEDFKHGKWHIPVEDACWKTPKVLSGSVYFMYIAYILCI